LCPNPQCPSSPNYGLPNSPLIFVRRQEKIYKYQQNLKIRTIKLHSPSLQTKKCKIHFIDCNKYQTKKFKDHFANCCKHQDSCSQLSQPHCNKNQRNSKSSPCNSIIAKNVLQSLSSNKLKPHHLATGSSKKIIPTRAQWSPTVWSPSNAPFRLSCKNCHNEEICT
jgi:hypothetical protein